MTDISPLSKKVSLEELREKFPLHLLSAIRGETNDLTEKEKIVLEKIISTDWTKETLSLSNQKDLETAALAVSLGAVIVYGFGNLNAIASHPHLEAVKYVNQTKGRPENQPGSITTTKSHIESVFDWAQLPKTLKKEQVLKLIDLLYNIGPFGFRGPAAAHIPDHLTTPNQSGRSTQLITPGYFCPSNQLLEKIFEQSGINFLFATSPNISRHLTGTNEEAAHYKMSGVQKDFGKKSGYFMIAHDNENLAHQNYPHHDPMSTSIIAFDQEYRTPDGKPAILLDRHGSLHLDYIIPIVKACDLDIILSEKAKQRLSVRKY